MMHWNSSGFGRHRRRDRSRWCAVLLMLIASALVADAPRTRLDRAMPVPGRTLRIVGSRNLGDPVARWARIFKRTHPEIRVTTSLYGTGIAAGALADGLADVAPLHRALKPDEQRFLDAAGVEPILVSVESRDRPAIYVYIRKPAIGRPDPVALEFARVALNPNERSSALAEALRAMP